MTTDLCMPFGAAELGNHFIELCIKTESEWG